LADVTLETRNRSRQENNIPLHIRHIPNNQAFAYIQDFNADSMMSLFKSKIVRRSDKYYLMIKCSVAYVDKIVPFPSYT